MKKKIGILIFALLLIVAAVFAASCERKPIKNNDNNITPPTLIKTTITRKNSNYVDDENILCLKLNGNVCEPVIVTLEFTNNSNLDIYSVKINSVNYDKASFKNGYSSRRVQIEIVPLFKNEGNYSFDVTEIYYSTGSNIKMIQNFEAVTVPVKVNPSFSVTLDFSQTILSAENQIEKVDNVKFSSDLSFLRSNTAMNNSNMAPDGFGFVGWYANPNPDINKDKSYLNTYTYEFYKDMTFYAVYECLYTYNADAATGSTKITGLTATGRKSSYFKLPDILGGYPVKYIGENAFLGTSISSLECNPSLITIMSRAFQNCTSLSSISLNEGLTEIQMYAFSGCTKLKTMQMFPSSLTTLGVKAFEYCGWTSRINTYSFDSTLIIPNTMVSIGDNCFQLSTFKNVYFEFYGEDTPPEVSFGKQLFYKSASLETVKTAVEYAGYGKFENRSNGLRRIPAETFQYCDSLKSVELSEGLTEIGNSAFMCVSGNMKNFTSIKFPDSLEHIASYAFANAPLASIEFKSNNSSRLKTIGDYAFQVSNLSGRLDLYTPMLDSYGASPFWGSLGITSIFMHTEYVPYFKSNNTNVVQNLNPRLKYYVPQDKLNGYINEWKVVFDIYGLGTSYNPIVYAKEDVHDNGKYSYQKKTVDGNTYLVLTNIFDHAGNTVIIEDTITVKDIQYPIKEIGSFVASKDITTVQFVKPSNLIEIAVSAFENSSSLINFCQTNQTGSKFTVFENLQRIGEKAFSGTAITEFIAPESLNYIGYEAFRYARSLNFVMIRDNIINPSESLNLLISASAFANCSSLDTVVLGKRVTTIGSQAFGYCNALGTFVMEHTKIPSFTKGLGNSVIGILGDNNTVTTIYTTSSLISEKSNLTSAALLFSYRQYTYVEGYWDYEQKKVMTS